MTWPGDHTIKGHYSSAKGIIVLHIPLKDVGKPRRGAKLFNVLAFSTTETQPLSADPIFNLIDSTQPFTVRVR